MNNHLNDDGRLPIGRVLGKRPLNARRTLLAATVLAVAFGLCAVSGQASATTISIESQDTTVLPTTAFIAIPVSSTGDFILSTTGSVADQRSSPFGDTTSPYSVLSSTGAVGSATYNLANVSTFSFLWGSPDSYNSVTFYSGPGATGLIGTVTGSALTPSAPDTGFNVVTFLATGGTIGSVVFSDGTGQPAFEYADVGLSPTPLPAALPLYAAGIGVMGVLGWRRKRKQLAAA